MILSDRDIRRRLEDGDLVIDPLDDPELQIQPASVDCRLGRTFLEFQRTNLPCIHPGRGQDVSKYVTETVVGDSQQSLSQYERTTDATIEEREEFILHPGDFVLGTTKEHVEIPPDIIAHVEGRSSLGRLAIVVHASLPADEQLFLWTPEEGYGFYPIGDIVESQQPALAVSFDPQTLSVNTYPITDYITNPTKRIYRVTLQSGRQVHVTGDHNLFTLDEYGGVTRIPSEDAEGEYVIVPGTLPGPRGVERELDLIDLLDGDEEIIAYATDGIGAVTWSDDIGPASRHHYTSRNAAPLPCVRAQARGDIADVAFKQSDFRLPRSIPIDTEFGWVIGFYIAEGSVRRKQVQFVNRDRDDLERVAAWFERYDSSLYWSERDSGAYTLTVCSALWARIFEQLAGRGSEKTIPDASWNWEDRVLRAMLEGLLDGDGSRRESRSTLYSGNPDLVDRVMYLASRLDLLSSAYSRDRELVIEPSDVEWSGTSWAVDVRPDGHKKGQFVPTPSELLRQLRTEADLTLGEAAAGLDYRSKSSITNVEQRHYQTIKRETLRSFRDLYDAEGADTTRIDQILEGEVQFERVKTVEKTDRVEPTYDLEVQPNGRPIENFLGGRGGIFLSNTAGIVDPGYRGQITLELSNLGNAPVALEPDMRISQLTFTELSSPAERPYGSERGSKYQNQRGPQASRIEADHEFDGNQKGGDPEA